MESTREPYLYITTAQQGESEWRKVACYRKPRGESKMLGRGGQVHPTGPAGDSNGDQIMQSRVKVVLGEIWDILPIRLYVSFMFGEV
ncbi:hypothetical protein E2C01_055253 [Portunus trituberculatus]|uniref:Uncharacterized protein n=1 Tax=Portunus trituberculatus TaxID=210409 RepID=A0A5B7GUC1_PORTR|nr:hypothetical protein [Portunus trituberculatus]